MPSSSVLFPNAPRRTFSLTRTLLPLYALLAVMKGAESYTHGKDIAWFKPDGFSLIATAPAQEEAAESQDAESADTSLPVSGEKSSPSVTGPERVDLNLENPVEQDLLENLVKRRQELEEWSSSITLRENILNATEKKLNRKLDELKELRAGVQIILDEYNEREDAKIARLVKIYENMRPKDAARIFNTMDNDILLQVLNRMREAKAAPVLASMQTDKVTFITEKLMTFRSIGDMQASAMPDNVRTP